MDRPGTHDYAQVIRGPDPDSFHRVTGRASAPDTPVATVTEDPIQELADEFKRLRAIQGHFSGSTCNDNVDKWMGRKHQLMIELGDRLGEGAYRSTQVMDLLAPPDAIVQEGDALYDLIRDRAEFEGPAGGAYEFLVYYWRGEHDSDSGRAYVQRFGLSGHEYVPVKRGTTTPTGKAEFHCK